MNSPTNLEKVSVAGIGGFAAVHHQAFLDLESEGRMKVIATCDPRADALRDLQEKFDFARRNISVGNDFHEMLHSAKSDWVSIATPIAYHGPMHRACVEQAQPCYLEKPPTLDPSELQEMIEVDKKAHRKTQVGFYYTYEPERILLKERLLQGDFGTLQRLGLRAASRRTEDYYQRSPWAGRLMLGRDLILDSCMGNAMAHHVHNILFFAGTHAVNRWGSCHSVEARLFRANPIEGSDTAFVRGRVANDIEFRIALTHACEETYSTEESLFCDRATIRINPRSHISILYHDGRKELIPIAQCDNLIKNFRLFGSYVRGESSDVMSTLEDCQPFVVLNALSYVSATGIENVDSSRFMFVRPATGPGYWRITGIEQTLDRFVETGDFSLTRHLSATNPEPAQASIPDLHRFRDVISGICALGKC